MLLRWKTASNKVTENNAANTAAIKLRIVVLSDKITTPVQEYDNY